MGPAKKLYRSPPAPPPPHQRPPPHAHLLRFPRTEERTTGGKALLPPAHTHTHTHTTARHSRAGSRTVNTLWDTLLAVHIYIYIYSTFLPCGQCSTSVALHELLLCANSFETGWLVCQGEAGQGGPSRNCLRHESLAPNAAGPCGGPEGNPR